MMSPSIPDSTQHAVLAALPGWTPVWVETVLGNPWYRGGVILAVALVVIVLLRLILFPILTRATKRTGSDLDDSIVATLRPTVLLSLFLVALLIALVDLLPSDRFDFWARGLIYTWLILAWGKTVSEVGALFFTRLSRRADSVPWIQPRTLPLIHFTSKVIIFATISWSVLAVWHINLTGWLASAGVAGIAVGFAAKDTLANFISGVFILVDAPYSVGEYIVIDGVTRGEVTDIGMRSTRILTRENVEVTVPNAVIGNAKIINESSGPSTLMRVGVGASVAYGSDVDQVREVLLGCAQEVKHVSYSREPVVRFMAMGASSLDFEVRVWIERPEYRGLVVDELNTRIYKALNAAGIPIPFPQQDVYVKEWPGVGQDDSPREDA